MGRELRRVPLDFNWPLNKVWGGYLNPFYSQAVKCDACAGSGYSPRAKLFHDQWYGNAPFDAVAYGSTPISREDPVITALAKRNTEGRGRYEYDREVDRLYNVCFKNHWKYHLNQADVDALVAADRLWDFTRKQLPGKAYTPDAFHPNGVMKESNGYVPTVDEVNQWARSTFNQPCQYTCETARCAREGIERNCAKCGGETKFWPSPEIKQQYENWKPSDPPKGPGFQLWETTSEGSPISPVFETLDALSEYSATSCTTFGSFKVSAAEWRAMLDDEGRVSHREGNMVFL